MQVLVNKFGNIMRKKGVEKGDRVLLYMPNLFQLNVAILGLGKIGAVHVVVVSDRNVACV